MERGEINILESASVQKMERRYFIMCYMSEPERFRQCKITHFLPKRQRKTIVQQFRLWLVIQEINRSGKFCQYSWHRRIVRFHN